MEHAPPQCFFPDDRDERGNCVYRRDLIKVPSCDDHNTNKSTDDTYALWHLASLHGVNKCGEMMHRKLRRMAEHDHAKRNSALMKKLLGETVGISEDGHIAGRADGKRMQQFLCSVARAVYFFETFKKLSVPLKVTNLGNFYRDQEHLNNLHKREAFFDSEMADAPSLGSNPEVFTYSIHEKVEGIIIVRMIFYGTLKHWVYHHPRFLDASTSANIF